MTFPIDCISGEKMYFCVSLSLNDLYQFSNLLQTLKSIFIDFTEDRVNLQLPDKVSKYGDEGCDDSTMLTDPDDCSIITALGLGYSIHAI